MTCYICVTCGTEFPATIDPPAVCPICLDERQYVGFQGQQWTTLEDLRLGHHNTIEELEAGLLAIRTQPPFAINQRALFLQLPGGNILWDCISLLDEHTKEFIGSRGGLAAIAISHPHYYTTMNRWSADFGNIPVYLHQADREFVMNPGPALQFWASETLPLHDGITLIRCGGHFEGGTVLYWPGGAEDKGVLLSGDIVQVVPDRKWVSFMYSYPNLIPLNADAIERIIHAVEPFSFDRIYGAFHPMQVMTDGKGAVRRSAERYIRAISPARLR